MPGNNDSAALIPSEPLSEEAEQHARLLANQYNVDGPERRVAKMTLALKRKFCEGLALGGSVTLAADAIGVARNTPYYQRSIDPEFAEAWDDARERAADRCEDRLNELAMESTHPAHIIFLLKNLRPEKWRDRKEIKVERPHDDGGSLGLPDVALDELLEIVKERQEQKRLAASVAVQGSGQATPPADVTVVVSNGRVVSEQAGA